MHRLSQISVGLIEKDRPSAIFVPGKKLSSARGSVHQTGLDSFFSKKEAKPTSILVDLVPKQDKDNVIVLVDSDSSASASKRKSVESGASHQSPEKKVRPN